MTATVEMPKAKPEKSPPPGQPRQTRTVAFPLDVGRMIVRTAVLKEFDNAAVYAAKLVTVFLDRWVGKRTLGGPPLKPDELPEVPAEIRMVNVSVELAERIKRTAKFDGLKNPALLNAGLLRAAATADYLDALEKALKEMGWRALPPDRR